MGVSTKSLKKINKAKKKALAAYNQ
jgi:hypothetical protein